MTEVVASPAEYTLTAEVYGNPNAVAAGRSAGRVAPAAAQSVRLQGRERTLSIPASEAPHDGPYRVILDHTIDRQRVYDTVREAVMFIRAQRCSRPAQACFWLEAPDKTDKEKYRAPAYRGFAFGTWKGTPGAWNLHCEPVKVEATITGTNRTMELDPIALIDARWVAKARMITPDIPSYAARFPRQDEMLQLYERTTKEHEEGHLFYERKFVEEGVPRAYKVGTPAEVFRRLRTLYGFDGKEYIHPTFRNIGFKPSAENANSLCGEHLESEAVKAYAATIGEAEDALEENPGPTNPSTGYNRVIKERPPTTEWGKAWWWSVFLDTQPHDLHFWLSESEPAVEVQPNGGFIPRGSPHWLPALGNKVAPDSLWGTRLLRPGGTYNWLNYRHWVYRWKSGTQRF